MAKTSGPDLMMQVLKSVELLQQSVETVADAVDGMRTNVGSLARALGAMAKQTREQLQDHESRSQKLEARHGD